LSRNVDFDDIRAYSRYINLGEKKQRERWAGSLGAPRAVHYRDELTNHVIGAASAAEFAIRQDILV
jgi:hypothetical protein